MSLLLKFWRRFRFRSRSRIILLLVILLAIPCAWMGSEWKHVHDRLAMIDRIEAAGGAVYDNTDSLANAASIKSTKKAAGAQIVIEPGVQLVPLSALRRWLGDRNVSGIQIPNNFPDDDEKRILELFPQSKVAKFYPAPPDRRSL